MLVLTRKIGEDIVIDDNIIVTILGVKGRQVKIGVNASKEVKIYRREIYERILMELAKNDCNGSKK